VERLAEPDERGRTVRLTVDLPPDFALNQPLSTFALAAVELLDPAGESFALDVLSVIEATLEDPRQVLQAQQSKARAEAIAQLKAEGVEYADRVRLIEQVSYPQPLAELLEAAFASYCTGHPWLIGQSLSAKSVVRDMYTQAMTFNEYVGYYGLNRSEGLLLRYLSDAYRALRSSVPPAARTEALEDLTSWLGELVRQIDSSLLDEWQRLADPAAPAERTAFDAPARDFTAHTRAFTVAVRNAMFRRVELAARHAYAELGELDAGSGWDAEAWQAALAGYFAEYDRIGIGQAARGKELCQLDPGPQRWQVRQILDDPAGDRDWAITAEIDLAASDEAGEPVLLITEVGPATAGFSEPSSGDYSE